MLLYVSMILCFYVSIIKPSLVFSHFLGFVIREAGLNRARGIRSPMLEANVPGRLRIREPVVESQRLRLQIGCIHL
jgi:hypothetical protein